MLLNDPTNDLLNFGFPKIPFRSSRSDAEEDDYGHEFEEDSGRFTILEFDQGVLNESATSLDMLVRFFDIGMELQSYTAYCTFPYSTPCNTSHHPVHCICMRSNRIHGSHHPMLSHLISVEV